MSKTDEVAEGRLHNRMWWLLGGLALGTLGVAAEELMKQSAYDAGSGLMMMASVTGLTGWLLAVVLILIARFDGSGSFLSANIIDERVQENRWRAYQAGLEAVVVLQMLFIIFGGPAAKATGLELNIDLTANLTVGVGLASSILRFQLLNR